MISSANDGHEFNQRRAANDPSLKLLTAEDVASNKSLDPVRAKDYFTVKSDESAPHLESREGSLFFVKGGDAACVARCGDGIVYGTSVSRNEFAIDRGIFPAPDGLKAAFYRKDESRVTLYPFLDPTTPDGSLKQVRYPMNGGVSERISVGVYDFETGKTIYLDTSADFDEERYLTNVCWNPSSTEIFIQVLDRSQKDMHLNHYSALDGKFLGTVLCEHNDDWVDPQYPLYWIDSRRCIYSTDCRDGYWNLYVVDLAKNTVKRLADWDSEMKYEANDGKYVYFTGPDYHPVNNYLYRASLKTRKVEQLTKEVGWHTIEMSPDCKSFLDVYESLDQPPVSRVISTSTGKVLEVVNPAKDVTEGWAYTEIDMGTVTSANGSDLNYYRMVKPLGFDPSKKYPVILYVYGGPHSQLVKNNFLGGLRRWDMFAAQKGFVVFCIDGRGTRRHSSAYERAIKGRCGVCEMEDQMQAVRMLQEIPWIDKDRIGVYGWSYGGFMSLSLATGNPDVFKVCFAGGPVIDWRWYEVMYGERYMGKVQDAPAAFDAVSLVPKAKNLKAKTLIVHGGLDETVVPLHSMKFVQECIDNGVKVNYFLYPKEPHNMRGKDKVHLQDKILDWFLENL